MVKEQLDLVEIWKRIRYHAFSLYEREKDPDEVLDIIESIYDLSRTHKAGINAELNVYHIYRDELRLEPLLDAGVKADFTGIKKGIPTNFDVTTNLKYKDIEDYREIMQNKRKIYEIILVKDDGIEFFPLKFPICEDCNHFAHYILFMSDPSSRIHHYASTGQMTVKYCPHCDEYTDVESYDFMINSITLFIEQMENDQKHDELKRPEKEVQNEIINRITSVVNFFEKESGFLYSGIAERDWVVTRPSDGEGYWGSRVYWIHPLASPYINSILNYYVYNGSQDISDLIN